jgi:hypothetical protein
MKQEHKKALKTMRQLIQFGLSSVVRYWHISSVGGIGDFFPLLMALQRY